MAILDELALAIKNSAMARDPHLGERLVFLWLRKPTHLILGTGKIVLLEKSV